MIFAAATGVTAQNVCPCIPSGYVWIAYPCNSWNCAQASMIMANGDPFVIALPTASAQYKWVVIKRLRGGTVIGPPDEPFAIDGFGSISEATARFASLDTNTLPMMITVPDGQILIIRLRQPELRRRTTH